jgi:hypothetical protein
MPARIMFAGMARSYSIFATSEIGSNRACVGFLGAVCSSLLFQFIHRE